ncbi:MAG: transcription elongation factor GreA, partial [Planctomycetota bacterium]|nr:transcription elongation factor GreA [Planctomycetota bacterium]
NSHGGKAPLKAVREELVEDVVDKKTWSKWWTRAKKALLKDPKIRIGKGSSPLLEVRDEAKSIEQEVAEKMTAQTEGIAQVAIGREYLRTLGLTDSLVASIRPVIQASLAKYEDDPSQRLALLYLQVDLKGDEGAAALSEAIAIIDEAESLTDLIHPLDVGDRKRAVAHVAKTAASGWQDQLIQLLQAGDADVADAVQEGIRGSRPDLLINFYADLSSNPGSNPNLFLWYTRGILQRTIPNELVPGEKRSAVMEKLLTLASVIGLENKRVPSPEQKEWLRHVRSFFTSRRLKTFREFVEDRSIMYARYLFAKVKRNHGFTDQTKSALLDVVEGEHADLHTTATRAVSAVPAGDVIYTTLRGYHTKESELKHLLEVDVPANAEDLGRAASFGDISENAEYSAALEKQERLMTRVRELREALDKARILDPGEVTTDRVVVGTRVQLKNVTRNREETYSLLGPWDTDVESGVISYLSPVGLGLLGKEEGSNAEIDLPEGRVEYEVIAIDVVDASLLDPEAEV